MANDDDATKQHYIHDQANVNDGATTTTAMATRGDFTYTINTNKIIQATTTAAARNSYGTLIKSISSIRIET